MSVPNIATFFRFLNPKNITMFSSCPLLGISVSTKVCGESFYSVFGIVTIILPERV